MAIIKSTTSTLKAESISSSEHNAVITTTCGKYLDALPIAGDLPWFKRGNVVGKWLDAGGDLNALSVLPTAPKGMHFM
jgi:hypothetical protein